MPQTSRPSKPLPRRRTSNKHPQSRSCSLSSRARPSTPRGSLSLPRAPTTPDRPSRTPKPRKATNPVLSIQTAFSQRRSALLSHRTACQQSKTLRRCQPAPTNYSNYLKLAPKLAHPFPCGRTTTKPTNSTFSAGPKPTQSREVCNSRTPTARRNKRLKFYKSNRKNWRATFRHNTTCSLKLTPNPRPAFSRPKSAGSREKSTGF